jgi:hypothetical protein
MTFSYCSAIAKICKLHGYSRNPRFFQTFGRKKRKDLARLGGFLHGRTVGGTGRRRLDQGGFGAECDPQDLQEGQEQIHRKSAEVEMVSYYLSDFG